MLNDNPMRLTIGLKDVPLTDYQDCIYQEKQYDLQDDEDGEDGETLFNSLFSSTNKIVE